jgi:phosphonate transport system substrate-binding protein
MGVKVTYTPVTDYGAAVRALVAGKVDFAWLGGFTHVLSRNQGDMVPLVMRSIDKQFKSAFIASTASGINGPDDLKGKTFAFGSKSSTSGRLMPQHFLETRFNITPKKDFRAVMFSGSHPATVKMVEGGRVQAGALNNAIWERLNKEGKVDASRVRRIWVTPEYVDYVWTARKAVPKEIRAAFVKAFLDLDGSKPDDREILGLQRAKSFVTASPSDFDAIENAAKSIGLLK